MKATDISVFDLDQIKTFVDNGGDINEKDITGETLLIKSIRNYNIDVEIIKDLVSLGANVNEECNAYWTPLKWACHYNNLDSVKFLVGCGADVNKVENENVWSVLDRAIFSGQFEMVVFLVESGAKFDKFHIDYICENTTTVGKKIIDYLYAQISSRRVKAYRKRM